VAEGATVRSDGVAPNLRAELSDGPLAGRTLEVDIVEGRAPATLDVPATAGETYRYCLADMAQTPIAAKYTFLYVL